jgi:hypothetical protein
VSFDRLREQCVLAARGSYFYFQVESSEEEEVRFTDQSVPGFSMFATRISQLPMNHLKRSIDVKTTYGGDGRCSAVTRDSSRSGRCFRRRSPGLGGVTRAVDPQEGSAEKYQTKSHFRRERLQLFFFRRILSSLDKRADPTRDI